MSEDRPPSPARLLRRHGLRPRRSLGQHFLSEPRVAAAISRATGVGAGDTVVEIGAGLGSLTRLLLDTGARVVALERDRALVPILRELFADHPRLEVVHADALRFDYGTVEADPAPAVVGNLPYNISAPLIFRLLEASADTGPWTLMFQREVARRLLAAPGTKEWGALTALVLPRRRVETVLEVGRGAFHPPPKVDSAVVRMTARARPWFDDVPPEDYRRVVRAVFATRRKTLRNSLNGGFATLDLGAIDALLGEAGIDGRRRGETLALEEFAALADAVGRREAC